MFVVGPFESTYPTAVPERDVGMWQNSIETIIALGEGDRIVAGMGYQIASMCVQNIAKRMDKIPYKDTQVFNRLWNLVIDD